MMRAFLIRSSSAELAEMKARGIEKAISGPQRSGRLLSISPFGYQLNTADDFLYCALFGEIGGETENFQVLEIDLSFREEFSEHYRSTVAPPATLGFKVQTLSLLNEECARARRKHQYPSFRALIEEVGEVAKELRESAQISATSLDLLRQNLNQVAVVALRLIEEGQPFMPDFPGTVGRQFDGRA